MEKQRKKRETYAVDEATIAANAAGTPRYAFAMTLNKIMLEKGVDQIALAKDLGYSSGTVSNYRNGKGDPKISQLVEIAQYLGVDWHYLMTGASSENHNIYDATGLNDEAIDWLRNFEREEVFTGKEEYKPFINKLFVSAAFQALVYQLFKLNIASEAARTYDNAINSAYAIVLNGRNEENLTSEELTRITTETFSQLKSMLPNWLNDHGVSLAVREVIEDMEKTKRDEIYRDWLSPEEICRYYAREHFEELLDGVSGKKKLRKALKFIDGKLVL